MPNPDQLPAARRDASASSDTASSHDLKAAHAPRTVPVQQNLPLDSRPVRTPAIQPRSRPRQLWLSIHLPELPLDALRARTIGPACAVVEELQGVRRIMLASRAARTQGILTGLSVNAALALVPALGLLPREPEREAQMLAELAARVERFTPLVSIEKPDGLLLEIAGSLPLFGGVDVLRQQVEAELAERVTISLGIAPTPLAALWLARNGTRAMVMHTERLAGTLGSLPLQCLRWPETVGESLHGMGIGTIGDCLRLPRHGFARRFGALRLLQLDRALGRLPDPRASHRSPERFLSECELAEEQSDREWLLEACQRLLERLERFLMIRQVVVQQLRFSFFHLEGTATHLMLGRLEPGYAADHWHELLAMKFDDLLLPAPVITIRLRGGRMQAWQAATETLPFSRASAQGRVMPVSQLMERLAARIGDESVHGVAAVAEHRPQYAWSTVKIDDRVPQCALPACPWYAEASQFAGTGTSDIRRAGRLLLRRPLWMLAEPLLLAVDRKVPQYHGPLRLEAGPERLETGWWDGNGIARDYFVTVNPKGVRLWIYRTRDPRNDWYLHGIFG